MAGNSNKRCNASENNDSGPEAPQSKKQITSDERGAPVPARKDGRKQVTVIDLESPGCFVAPRKLMAKGDDFRRDAFPRFHRGTVYIQLVELHSKYTYTLHKDLLELSSSRLARCFQSQVFEHDSAMAREVKMRAGLEFFLDLQYVQHIKTFALVLVAFTVPKCPQRDQFEEYTSVQPASTPKHSRPSCLRIPPSPKSPNPILNETLPTPRSMSNNVHITPIEDKAALNSPITCSEVEALNYADELLMPDDKSAKPEASSVITYTRKIEDTGAAIRSKDEGVELEVENNVLAIGKEGEDGVLPTESAPKRETDDGATLQPLIQLEAHDGVITIIKSAITETNSAVVQIIKLSNSQITEMENAEPALQDFNSSMADMIKSSKSAMKGASNDALINTPGSTNETTYAFVEITEPASNPDLELKRIEATRRESAYTEIDMIQGSTSETIQLAGPEMELKALGSTIHMTTPMITTKLENPTTDSSCYAHGETGEDFPINANVSSNPFDDMEVRRQKSVEAHHNLFLIFYDSSPELDDNDVNNAFDQIEHIVLLAKLYCCVDVLRHCLIDQIFQRFGHELCKAILDNPPRWLLLSIDLSCAPIFKQAMVHLVGMYPHYPWIAYPHSKIPPCVLSLIRKKVDELRNLKACIDEELFASSISLQGKSLTFTENFEKPGFGTWFVVQIWQDWLRESIWKHAAAKHGVGTMYRLLAKGGSAYLDHRDVYDRLIANKCNDDSRWVKEDVEDDLNIMKDFARKKVKDLVVNNSMLDVEESGIQHLTCTYIRNDELPWVKNKVFDPLMPSRSALPHPGENEGRTVCDPRFY